MMAEETVTALIEAVEQADSALALLEAVRTLAAARHQAAAPTLLAVLGYNNPGAAVAAVEGLIALGEAAVPLLLEQLDSYNYGARAWAIRALAGIGDPRALDLLIEAAREDFSLSVRRAAAKGLGSLRWAALPPARAREEQGKVLATLLLVTQDPEWVVRYAGAFALQSLARSVVEREGEYRQQILATLQQLAAADSELAVRARARLALWELSA